MHLIPECTNPFFNKKMKQTKKSIFMNKRYLSSFIEIVISNQIGRKSLKQCFKDDVEINYQYS